MTVNSSNRRSAKRDVSSHLRGGGGGGTIRGRLDGGGGGGVINLPRGVLLGTVNCSRLTEPAFILLHESPVLTTGIDKSTSTAILLLPMSTTTLLTNDKVSLALGELWTEECPPDELLRDED